MSLDDVLKRNVLKKPVLTEKSSLETENFNRYGFIVDRKANKHQIKAAVESHYDVRVLSVRTSLKPGKLKRFGRHVKKTPKIKKAFIELEEGQRIEFFKGI